MTTFNFGWGPVPAHQHINGGGWVADSAIIAETAYVGPQAQVYGKAQVSGKARVYGEARVSATTDYLCVGPLGSRGSHITITKAPALQFCTGCFCGGLDTFSDAVTQSHGDNRHAQEYRAVIAFALVWAGIEEEG